MHDSERQLTSAPTNPTHELVLFSPSQVVALHFSPPVAPGQAARGACGIPTTGEQVPTDVETSHAWHWSVQALSQQTPSTQKPDAQVFVCVHSVPGASFLRQAEVAVSQ